MAAGIVVGHWPGLEPFPTPTQARRAPLCLQGGPAAFEAMTGTTPGVGLGQPGLVYQAQVGRGVCKGGWVVSKTRKNNTTYDPLRLALSRCARRTVSLRVDPLGSSRSPRFELRLSYSRPAVGAALRQPPLLSWGPPRRGTAAKLSAGGWSAAATMRTGNAGED